MADIKQPNIKRLAERLIDQIQDHYRRLDGVNISWQDAQKKAIEVIKEVENE